MILHLRGRGRGGLDDRDDAEPILPAVININYEIQFNYGGNFNSGAVIKLVDSQK